MAGNAAKRVVLYRFDRLPQPGVIQLSSYLAPAGIELITLDGAFQTVPFSETKGLCFTSDPDRAALFGVEALFERRPKVPGLWTRFTLKDGDQIDGILSHNLLEWPAEGYLFVPPKASSARQRVFIPRVSLVKTELRGVVGVSAGHPGRRAGREPARDQLEMFPDRKPLL